MSNIDTSGEFRGMQMRAIFIQSVIAIVLCLVILSIIGRWWWDSQQPQIANISITDVVLAGPSALCPGEPLLISYIVHIDGAGVMDRDATTWKTIPPYTIVNSTPQRMVIDGSIDQEVEEAWVIPGSYLNPLTGRNEPLPSGRYRRTISLSSLGRNATSSIGSVDFVIKDECSEVPR